MQNSFVRLLSPLLTVVAATTLVVFGAMPSFAQERVVPRGQAEVMLSYSPIVKRARPAVVNVYVRRRVRQFTSPFFNDPFFKKFFGRDFGVPRSRMENSLGSGVIVTADGVVVTNYHVIKGGGTAEIKVALADRREFDAQIILQDEKTDLAVLKIDTPDETFPFLSFEDSDNVEVGDLVLAIGNPFGVGQTVTSGIVSALARTKVGRKGVQFFIQTDAAINPGNSGGALVDMAGRLVGINTAIFSRSGGSHGIGFAIPSNLVRLIVESAITDGQVKRPWFGAKLESVTRDIAEAIGLEKVSGSLVTKVYSDSAAEKAGLRRGDVVISVDGKTVADPRAFNYRFTTRGVGGQAEVGVIRNGREKKLRVRLYEAPRNAVASLRELQGRHPFDGASVADLSPVLADELNLGDVEGVIVVKVDPRSIAAQYGFRAGDVISRINRERIENVGQLEELVRRRPPVWRVAVVRRGRTLSMVVPGVR